MDFDQDGVVDLFFSEDRLHHPVARGGPAHFAAAVPRPGGNGYSDERRRQAASRDTDFGQGLRGGDLQTETGFPDLYIARAYGTSQFLTNFGDGTIEDATPAARIMQQPAGTSPAFADLDDDGLLDLYVVNYADWSPGSPPASSRTNCWSDLLPSDDAVGSLTASIGIAGRTFEDIGPFAGVAVEEVGRRRRSGSRT